MKTNQLRLSLGLMLTLLAWSVACGSGGDSESSGQGTQYPGGDLPGTQGGDLGAIDSPDTDPTYISSEAPSGGSGNPTSVRLLLTDAPNPTIDSATVTLSDVTVHHTGGASHSVLDEPLTLDLLDLQNGVTELLGEIELDPGKITMIRLVVEEAEVVSEGVAIPVEIPSNEIKLNRPIDLCDGGEVEIVIDFDALESLRYNKGREVFTLHPVVHITEINQDCPPEESGDEDEDAFEGPLGWLSIVVPPVVLEDFQSLVALIDDVQVHDQGIGQVSTLTESYEADLLESERQLADATTGEPLYTVLLPPIEVPAGELDQVRLFFQTITAVDAEGREIVLSLPSGDDGDGLKFFGSIQVCENALTVLQWDLQLDADSIDFASGEDVTIHPVIQNPNVVVTCEPLEEDAGDQAISDDDDDANDDDDEGEDANDDDDDEDDDDDANDDDDDDDDEEGEAN